MAAQDKRRQQGSSANHSPASSIREAAARKGRGSVSSQRSFAEQSATGSFETARSTPPSSDYPRSSTPDRRHGSPDKPLTSPRTATINGTSPSSAPTSGVASLGFARVLTRPFTPQLRASMDFEITPELIAEIDRAHDLSSVASAAAVAVANNSSAIDLSQLSNAAPNGALSTNSTNGGAYANAVSSGLAGSAYAGGIISNGSSPARFDPTRSSESLHRQLDRTDNALRPSRIANVDALGRSLKPYNSDLHLPTTVNGRTESPQYHTPLSTPQLGPAVQTPSNEHESYFPYASLGHHSNNTSTSSLRLTPPALSRITRDTPPAHPLKTRTPDKSLPLQEEVEDDESVDETDVPPSPETDRSPRGVFSPAPVVPQISRRQQSIMQAVQLSDTDHGSVRNQATQPLVAPHADQDRRSQDEGRGTPRSSPPKLPMEHPPVTSKPASANVQNHVNGINGSRQKSRNTGQTQLENGHEHVRAPHARPVYQPMPPAAQFDDHGQNGYYDPVAAYYRTFLRSPMPPTPFNNQQSAMTSPSPMLSGMRPESGIGLPPYSPVPPVGSPYPYPFAHIRRGQAPAVSQPPTIDMSLAFDPAVIREQLARQMQIYAMNNAYVAAGPPTESTLSPSSTPYPGPAYNPWTYLQTSRVYGGPQGGTSVSSIRSSPSHEPIPLPTRPHNIRRRPPSDNHRYGGPTTHHKQARPPPRVQSTQPRETSPEPSSGEETAGQEDIFLSGSSTWMADDGTVTEPDPHGDWIDDDPDADTDDLLELEYHTDYVTNADKRQRRWDTRWDALLRAFSALDRETDTTMVLMAAPPNGSNKMRCVASRALRRAPYAVRSAGMSDMRQLFAKVAAQRDAERSNVSSLVDRLVHSAEVGAGAGEEELRRALDTALRSLSTLGKIYEERELRWGDEMRRLDEDRERVRVLLAQVLGMPFPSPAPSPAV